SRIVKSDCVRPLRCAPRLSVTTTSIVRGALLSAASSAAAAKANSIAAVRTAKRKRTIPGLLLLLLNRRLRKPRLLGLLIHHPDGDLVLSPAEHYVHVEIDHLVAELPEPLGRQVNVVSLAVDGRGAPLRVSRGNVHGESARDLVAVRDELERLHRNQDMQRHAFVLAVG